MGRRPKQRLCCKYLSPPSPHVHRLQDFDMMSTNHKNTEMFSIEPIFLHFKRQKVAISHAIKKPFPFLEGLRDHDLITDKKYHDFQESFRDLVPLHRVIYRALEELEKNFNMTVLQKLFCKVNMENYPDLKFIRRSFKNVFPNALCSQGSARGDLNSELSLKQGPSESCSQGSLTWSPLDSSSSDGGKRNDRGTTTLIRGIQTENHQPSEPHNRTGAAPSTSEKTCPCVMGSPTYVAEDQEARMGSSQEAMDTRNNITVGESRKRRGGNRSGGQAATRRKKREKTPESSVQNRVLRRRRNETADFSAELLPVTCGNLKGMLHKDKFKQGTSVMSIQCEDGNWFTPQEFEIMGGHERAKNWKLSLRCYNWPLKFLIKRNFLPNPPQKYARKKKQGTQNLYHSQADPCMENSDECEVCRDGGTLFCCDTCPRAFHEECHIPAVEVEMTPWSCVFCRTQSLGSQESRPESEILQRQMVPQEQLKCEFVLLRVYCCPESSFFSKMPYYCYDPVVHVQEPMWLDMIKKKLSQQAYPKVKKFVQDMRLIFQNHRTTFKEPEFGKMGLKLESKFEKTFKEVFAIGKK
ncbi:nuclear body protein SP140-like protein isoform X3 [Meriones unguiculatus]|uniref:nuclear body protein SP140-like protein isoform X3 n=1 Tax=Meriones unguiculatus TaxID=10047 RepID=UPI00293E9B27|nr:nuclear body protein SP140-like protein isoform X3 [Meriones unguiculatus]